MAAKRKPGRPTKRTPELIDELIAHIRAGHTISSFCRKNEGRCSRTRIVDWMANDPALRERVEAAKADACIMIEDEIAEIADTPTAHENDVQHRRLQIFAREKRLIWNRPHKYGSKMQIGGAPDLPPLGEAMTADEKARRVAELLERAQRRIEGEADDGD